MIKPEDLTDEQIRQLRQTPGLPLYTIRMCDRAVEALGSPRTERARSHVAAAINARAKES